MRITIHVPDQLADEIKRFAGNERVSVSSLAAEALEYYLNEKRRKALGNQVLRLAGKTRVADHVHRELEEGRRDNGYRD